MSLKGIDFYASISESGQLPDAVRIKIRNLLKNMAGKDVVISIRRNTRRRTQKQSAWYKGFLIPTFRDYINSFGNDVDDDFADDVIKRGIGWVKKAKMPDGEMVTVPRSSREADIEEFGEIFIDKAIAWLAKEWFLDVPYPKERGKNG